MDILSEIKSRRSIRKYKSDPVPDDLPQKVIEAGSSAPTAHNSQALEFIVVRDKATKDALAKIQTNGPFIGQAPIIIIVLADRNKTNWPVYDGASAVENMLLEASSLGLGSCWIAPHYQDEVRALLNIPDHYEQISTLPLGYPSEQPTKTKNPAVVHREKYETKS